jgi:hypothetical protein
MESRMRVGTNDKDTCVPTRPQAFSRAMEISPSVHRALAAATDRVNRLFT